MWRPLALTSCFLAAAAADENLAQVLLHWSDDHSKLVVSWGINDTLSGDSTQATLHFGTSEAVTESTAAAVVPYACRRKPTSTPKYHMTFFNAEMPSPVTASVFYQVVVGDVKSEVFKVAAPAATATYAIFGDFGIKNDVAVARLTEDAKSGRVDAIIHAGDLAYNLDQENGDVGTEFMQAIIPFSARVPYMAVVGNHESCHTCGYNFTDFQYRFHALDAVSRGSESPSRLYYSYDVPHMHFVFFNSEAWLPKEPTDQVAPMLAWLEADLKKANEPANRKERPWIVAIGHKGWYMDSFDGADDIMNLFHKYGVDVLFCGHEHDYERYLPLHVPKVRECQAYVDEQPKDAYKSPKYMVTIVAGSPGNQEMHGAHPPPPTGAPNGTIQSYFDPTHFGYGYLTAHNATHLEWTWDEVHRDGSGVPKDSLWIEQSNHQGRADLPCKPKTEEQIVV